MKRSIEQYRRVVTLLLKNMTLSGRPFVTGQQEDDKTEIHFIVSYSGFRMLKYDKVKGIIIDKPNSEEMKIIEDLKKKLG